MQKLQLKRESTRNDVESETRWNTNAGNLRVEVEDEKKGQVEEEEEKLLHNKANRNNKKKYQVDWEKCDHCINRIWISI